MVTIERGLGNDHLRLLPSNRPPDDPVDQARDSVARTGISGLVGHPVAETAHWPSRASYPQRTLGRSFNATTPDVDLIPA